MKPIKLLLIGFLTVIFSGCIADKETDKLPAVVPKIDIPQPEGIAKKALSQIMTTENKVALTFNGLADEETMYQLLDELDRFAIKATFFLPGMRVAEEPELVKEILARGHTIQNNTLNHVIPDQLDYEEAYVEIFLANQVFQDKLNITPTYVRSRSGDSSPVFEQAATQLNMQVVSYSINPKDTQMQSAEEIAEYIGRFFVRGAIIELNTYINPNVIQAIELIYRNAAKAGYQLTTLEDVHASQYLKEDEPETNQLAVNHHVKDAQPKIIKKFITNQKDIALTFDDWATDRTLTTILDILDEYDVRSTFFLIGTGVERNPQLARYILERGHEVANHSYQHRVVTTMDLMELQEDIVKNDQILSFALQEKPKNYYRPAQGIVDKHTAQAIAATGIDYIVLYDVASFDWNLELSEDEVYQRIIDRVQPGSIIDMHILDDSHTIAVLPRIIKQLKQEGYIFKTISDLIATHDYEEGD